MALAKGAESTLLSTLLWMVFVFNIQSVMGSEK